MGHESLRSQLLSAGLLPTEASKNRGSDTTTVSRRLERLLSRYAGSAKIVRADFNAAVDAADAFRFRLSEDAEIRGITESLSGWERAAKRNPENSTYLSRLYVFSRHPSVSPVFLRLLADRHARFNDGQFGEDRWTRLAERTAKISPSFHDRLREAREPYQRANAEREHALRDVILRESVRRDKNDREHRLRRDAALDALVAQISRLRHDGPRVVRSSPTPTLGDIELCANWAGLGREEASRIHDYRTLSFHIGEYESIRLISARMAERVAADYYTDLGYKVRDISVQQLSNNDHAWKSHDLQADDVPLDIKNARRSFSSPTSFSELCVTKFKSYQRAGSRIDVRLVGVLSDYVPLGQFNDQPGATEVTVLGETSRQTLAQVSDWIRNATESRLELVDFDRPRFLPGWFFEYPDAHYRGRVAALDALPKHIQMAVDAGVPMEEMPLMLQVLSASLQGELSISDKGPKSRLIDLLRKLGFTRLTAVAWSLVELVRAAQGDNTADPLSLDSMLFPRSRLGPLWDLPFARLDPERYVEQMTKAIKLAWIHARIQISQFQRFQLSATGVLKGDRGNGGWVTILAYCGGFRPIPPKVRCGKSPLVMGQHESCPYCLRLVCPNCGYCGSNCSACDLRQKSLTKAHF